LDKVKKQKRGKVAETDTDAEPMKDTGKDDPLFLPSAAAAAAAASPIPSHAVLGPTAVGPSGHKGNEAKEGGDHFGKRRVAHVDNDRYVLFFFVHVVVFTHVYLS